MKVRFVLPYPPSLIRVRPHQLIRALAQRHDVSVLALATRENDDGVDALRALGVRIDLVTIRSTERLRACGSALIQGQSLQAAACHSTEMERRLRQQLTGDRPDIVHLEHFRAAYLRPVVPLGIPVLFDAVDCISLLQERTIQASHSIRQRLLARIEVERSRAYEARILGQFDRVIVTSADDAKALKSLSPSADVNVVPNGVDLDYFCPLDRARESATIVFSGKMSYHANVTAVLHFVQRILPLIRQRCPEVRFVIAGSAPPREIRDLARDPRIVVTGHVPDLREPLARATVAVCPVTVKVGIQNKVLEAMAMGIPVVCSREGAAGLEARPDDDFLVASDPTDFAGQVVHAIEDAALRDRLSHAGRTYVEARHQWSAAAAQIEALYHTMVDCDRTPHPLHP